jgi:hypothetical protein
LRAVLPNSQNRYVKDCAEIRALIAYASALAETAPSAEATSAPDATPSSDSEVTEAPTADKHAKYTAKIAKYEGLLASATDRAMQSVLRRKIRKYTKLQASNAV